MFRRGILDNSVMAMTPYIYKFVSLCVNNPMTCAKSKSVILSDEIKDLVHTFEIFINVAPK